MIKMNSNLSQYLASNSIINSLSQRDYPKILQALGISTSGIQPNRNGWIKVQAPQYMSGRKENYLLVNLIHGGWKFLNAKSGNSDIVDLIKYCGYYSNEKVADFILLSRAISQSNVNTIYTNN